LSRFVEVESEFAEHHVEELCSDDFSCVYFQAEEIALGLAAEIDKCRQKLEACLAEAERVGGQVEREIRAIVENDAITTDDTHGIDSTGQRFEYDPEPLPLLNPGLEN
jgi:hypothetical protein